MIPVTRAVRSAAAAILLAAASVPAVLAQEELPACDLAAAPSDCRLETWPEETQREAPSLFGQIEGTAWLPDAAGDAPPGGLDILAVGVGSVDIDDPRETRDLPGLLKAGKVKQAVRPGQNVLVRIVLERPLDDVTEGYAGIHVATDIDRSRSNNAPAGVVRGEQPFAGSEDVYSVTYASTTGKTQLLDSDLSTDWYRDGDPFAAAWATPTVLDILVRPEAVGDGLRVITFSSGAEGGYDSVAVGTGPMPVDGRVGLQPACLEASIATDPFIVRRLVENGQTLRNVEAPASWQGGASFTLDPEVRAALASLISDLDDDRDGIIGLASSVALFEEGAVMGQRPDVRLTLDGDRAQLALQLGLTRRGFGVLRELELDGTGNEAADAWLARATDALTEAMPPFRSGKRAGLLTGDSIGACVPGLIAPLEPAADAAESPGDQPEPAADAAEPAADETAAPAADETAPPA